MSGMNGLHSWTARSLVELAAAPPAPPVIGGLIYHGKRGTLFSGETESLKTWTALILAKAELDAGYPVAWADLDAMGAGDLLDRFRALGVPDYVVSDRFLYYEPEERLRAGLLDDVRAEILERGVRLFVIDAFNPFLSLHGLDPHSTPDVETFWREIADPLAKAGAAPTLLDHVTKNAESRGKYAYGSERKASGAIVHIGFRTVEAFARGKTGRALLTTLKDRPGYLPRPTIGRLVLDSDAEGLITYRLESDHSHAGDTFRPTVLMERVSLTLEKCSEPVTQTWIEENVKGKGPALRSAVAVLVEDGYVSKTETTRGWRLSSLRAYRESHDPVTEDDNATASQPRSHRVPELVSEPHDPTASPRPLRKQDGDARRSGTPSPNGDHSPSPSLDAPPRTDYELEALAADHLADDGFVAPIYDESEAA
jgi:hypothetical protein